MKFFNRVIVALTLCLGWQGVSQAQKLPSIQLQAGLYKIVAEVAATEQARQLGLMHRNYLPPDEGMLFVFESKGTHCFWMRNTKIPLAIAFLADDGKIVNIIEMKAMTEDNHCPSQPVRFALEMSQGWFTKKGLTTGNAINGIPSGFIKN